MIDPVILLTFIPAAIALNLTPGADMMFCLGTGLKAGPRAGLAASAGVAAGCMVHVSVAGAGLGAAIAAAPGSFDLIRWIGVAYLLWLAVSVLRNAGDLPSLGVPALGLRAAVLRGFLVNLTNPKVILFVLAFVPQFVDPARPVLLQFLILGGVIALGGFIINGIVGAGAGRLGRRMTRTPAIRRWLDRISATIFAALALRLALGHR